ncbi:MAG: hypothetical protein ACFFD2_18625 [Promethearchaeota archaeon]
MGIDQRLRMQEAATLLGGTPQHLRTWSNEGYIEAIVGKEGHRRFKWSEVKRVMHLPKRLSMITAKGEEELFALLTPRRAAGFHLPQGT